MIFPAIREALHDIKASFGSETIELGIERKDSVGFTTQDFGWYKSNGYRGLYDVLGAGGPSWSGEVINEAAATNLSAVWACRRIISEAAAFIPLDMMQETKAGKFPAFDHPLYGALKYQPNEEMSSMVWREALVGNIIMSGMGFGQIFRRSGTDVAMEIQPLTPGQVTMDRDLQKRRVFIVNPRTPDAKTYTVIPGKPHDILHVIGPSINGREGQGIVTQARQSFGYATAVMKYGAKYFANGGLQPGYLKLERAFKTIEDEKQFLADLTNAVKGSDNFHKWPALPPGVDFKEWGWKPEDSQFIATQDHTIPEICRWFLISPDLVGDMSKATLNNMEQLALRFVKMTLTAWLVRLEQDFRRCLLTPEEKTRGYYFRHKVEGLLRGDYLTRMQGHAIRLQNGIDNIDTVRDLEDENPLPDGAGQAHHIQLNMATVPGTGAPMITEQGILARSAARPAA